MGLFDGYLDPQSFADRGGLLGRLLSLRPDLAPDQQGDGRPTQGQSMQAPAQQPQLISTSEPAASAISSALADFYRQTILQPSRDIAGYVKDAVNDPAYFAHAIGPSLAGLGPVASQLPAAVSGATSAVRTLGPFAQRNGDLAQDNIERVQSLGSKLKGPQEIDGSAAPGISTATVPSPGNANVGSVGSPASSAFRSVQFAPASSIGSAPQWLGSPIAGSVMLPGFGLAASLASRRSSELIGGQPQLVAPVLPLPNLTPPFNDMQDALGPPWQLLQTFFDNTKDKGSGGGEEPEPDCEEERRFAVEECSKERSVYDTGPYKTRGPRRIEVTGPWTMDDCMKGFMHPKCGGNDSKDPANWFFNNGRKRGRGAGRKR